MQTIKDGFQHEQPDYWLNFGNPWEIERPQISYDIHFYGHVSVYEDGGRQMFKWHPGETVRLVSNSLVWPQREISALGGLYMNISMTVFH